MGLGRVGAWLWVGRALALHMGQWVMAVPMRGVDGWEGSHWVCP